MYRIWIGLQPRMIVFAVHTFVAVAVLFMHFWAFPVMGWPDNIKQKYPSYTQTSAAP